jgi:hypothetical protein
MNSSRIWDRNLGLEGEGKVRKFRGEIFEMGAGSRYENTEVHD